MNIKQELIKRNISQKIVSEILGVHVNTVCSKVNGDTPFTIEEAFKLKDVFFYDVDFRYLFSRD